MADFGISEGLMLAGGLASGAGTLGSASAQSAAGKAQQQAANYKAAQEDQQATQAIAAGQQNMFQQQRKTALTQSTLTARAAADGGTATDPTVLSLSQDIAGRGEINALDALWQGQDKATGLQAQASADRYNGAVAQQGADLTSTGTLLSGGASMLSGFGKLPSLQNLKFG